MSGSRRGAPVLARMLVRPSVEMQWRRARSRGRGEAGSREFTDAAPDAFDLWLLVVHPVVDNPPDMCRVPCVFPSLPLPSLVLLCFVHPKVIVLDGLLLLARYFVQYYFLE